MTTKGHQVDLARWFFWDPDVRKQSIDDDPDNPSPEADAEHRATVMSVMKRT